MNNKPCKTELLQWIDAVSFAVVDAQLFLDTHPDCQEALDFFNENSRLRNQVLKEYARYYGPLTIDTATESCNDYFDWVNEPWPWQKGVC